MTRYPLPGNGLATDAQSITAALGGRWHGGYGTARCPAHNDDEPSLSLRDGEGGRILAKCFAGCDWPAIAAALEQRNLLAGSYSPDGSDLPASRRADDDADRAKRARQAENAWTYALPLLGTAAERYLRGRGISCTLPASLKFDPEAWHGPTAKRFPALVARVEGGDGLAIHLTFLTPDGAKAAVEPAKISLGPIAGGVVRLNALRRRRVVVAEGIETALSLASGLLEGEFSLRAALSASGMTAFRLPPLPRTGPGELVIAVDGDPAGRAAGQQLARRADAAGWKVSIADPGDGLDWNDVLRGEARS